MYHTAAFSNGVLVTSRPHCKHCPTHVTREAFRITGCAVAQALVLTATGFVNGKGQFSNPYRIDTLNRSPNNLSQVIMLATPTAMPN